MRKKVIDETKIETIDCLNRNRVVFKVGKEHVVIDRINMPKYYINGVAFTEYDMRNLQKQVCYGEISHEVANSLNITDEGGNVFNFRPDGVLTNTPVGYGMLSEFTLSMLRQRGRETGFIKNELINL